MIEPEIKLTTDLTNNIESKPLTSNTVIGLYLFVYYIHYGDII